MEGALLAAVASPRRREILRLVWHEEQLAGAIHAAMPEISFGAVSQHLRSLSDAGLVTVRADGRCRHYRARREVFGSVGRLLERMWTDALRTLKMRAELEEARRGPRAGARRTRTTRRP